MSRVRSKNTKPELEVRSLLHKLGYRFTVNASNNKELPGKPDIVLPKFRTVIFVHGCFWHRHSNCSKSKLPETRKEWWTKKIEENKRRDERNFNELKAMGWNTLVVWECSISEGVKEAAGFLKQQKYADDGIQELVDPE